MNILSLIFNIIINILLLLVTTIIIFIIEKKELNIFLKTIKFIFFLKAYKIYALRNCIE
jgi:hypothetical protein